MRGLWHLQTELLNIGLHRPVLNTIFFFIVACLTFLLIRVQHQSHARNRTLWPEFKFFTIASVLLSM